MDSPLSTWTPASPLLREVPFLTQVNLRSGTPAAFEPVLGVSPPTVPGTVATAGDLGPVSMWMAGLRRAQTPPGATPVTPGYNSGIQTRPARPQPTPGPRLAPTPTSTQALAVLWLGPDEWLVVGPPSAPVAERLAEAAKGEFASIVDVSAHRTAIDVTGPRAWDLLAHGCALDGVAPGHCAQTLLARAGVILWGLDDGYRVLVRSSFARYLAAWLDDASVEY